MKYHISLGSNIGNREKNLAQAVSLLKEKGAEVLKKSSIYETSPVGVKGQPWFLNQVLEVQVDSEPRAFLRMVLGIEAQMGRTRKIMKGPRSIDIDILLAEDKVVHSADLHIPHPELVNRNFVLVPLKEIAFDAIHPELGKKIGDLWRESKDPSAVRPFHKRKR
jgi:2-amino-4-hydroxy-6-hydroxymethyldihydropteridine diphosphokinase